MTFSTRDLINSSHPSMRKKLITFSATPSQSTEKHFWAEFGILKFCQCIRSLGLKMLLLADNSALTWGLDLTSCPSTGLCARTGRAPSCPPVWILHPMERPHGCCLFENYGENNKWGFKSAGFATESKRVVKWICNQNTHCGSSAINMKTVFLLHQILRPAEDLVRRVRVHRGRQRAVPPHPADRGSAGVLGGPGSSCQRNNHSNQEKGKHPGTLCRCLRGVQLKLNMKVTSQ